MPAGYALLFLEARNLSFLKCYLATGSGHGRQPDKHGRIVGQITSVLPAKGYVDLAAWPQCKTIGRIDSIRTVGGKESGFERRCYISSRDLCADQLALAVCAYWGIENWLHGVFDVSFGEHSKTVRKDNAPQSFSLLRKIVLNLIRLDTTDKRKASLRLKRKKRGG